MKMAKAIAAGLLDGVGDESWELVEPGDSALHLRRRLTPEEMKLLHTINPACPVFTHGKALSTMAEVIPQWY